MVISPDRIGRRAAVVVSVVALTAMGACGDDTESAETDGSGRASGPAPDEMCTGGSVPQAAAYALDDGEFLWASCTEGASYRSVGAVTEDAVYLHGGIGDVVALDPADGSVMTDAPPPGALQTPDQNDRIAVGDVAIAGGQDDPVTAHAADGTELWSRPGVWVYDDVWASDDGAVFAIERESSRLVAYEIASGDVRWAHVGDPYREGLWPWHAEDGRLFTMWSNLQVRDTATGELLWATSYPPSLNPDLRLAGVATDGETVYVGIGTASSGGD